MAPRAIRLFAPQYTEEPVRGVRCTLHPYSGSVMCPTGSERAELPQLQQQGVSRLLTLRFWAPWSKMEDGEKAMQEGGCLRPYAVIACVRN